MLYNISYKAHFVGRSGEGFKDLFRTWWQGFNFRGSSSFVISEKIKVLKPLIGGPGTKMFLVVWKLESNDKEANERIFHWARSDY